MTPFDIKNRCAIIERNIISKGYYNPKVDVTIAWIGYDMTCHIVYRADSYSPSMDKFIHTSCDAGFDGLFEKVDTFVAGLKPVADAKRDAFIKAVAGLIEQGRDIGMEVDFLNPLTAMMDKLSTNIITMV
jgi:hypothetical protein